MKFLLDTHAFLWLVEGSPQLSAAAQAAVGDPLSDVYLSVASIWELAIKVGNGRLTLSDPLDVFVGRWTATYRIEQVPVESRHALAVATLPHHHRDPFDRLLVAQAQVEALTIVSADSKLSLYGAAVLW